MGRTPCCENLRLNKGLWTPEEDLILINHINTHGHKNWRALPREAGLLRCGKSCRLRWKNYLRPDIKRGNFSREEEAMIIQLHETLGNRWSAIAAKLPGRTDNEIKNVWHTHLKKRLIQQDKETKPNHSLFLTQVSKQQQQPPVNTTIPTHHVIETTEEKKTLSSSQCASSEVSSLTSNDHNSASAIDHQHHLHVKAESLDDDFWSQVLSPVNSGDTTSLPATVHRDFHCSVTGTSKGVLSSSPYDNVNFWYDVYMGEQELPEF